MIKQLIIQKLVDEKPSVVRPLLYSVLLFLDRSFLKVRSHKIFP